MSKMWLGARAGLGRSGNPGNYVVIPENYVVIPRNHMVISQLGGNFQNYICNSRESKLGGNLHSDVILLKDLQYKLHRCPNYVVIENQVVIQLRGNSEKPYVIT